MGAGSNDMLLSFIAVLARYSGVSRSRFPFLGLSSGKSRIEANTQMPFPSPHAVVPNSVVARTNSTGLDLFSFSKHSASLKAVGVFLLSRANKVSSTCNNHLKPVLV